jgi:hypothetical protein
VLAFGLMLLRFQTPPERIARRAHKLPFEMVDVLGLLPRFTGLHVFRVIGRLRAPSDLPKRTSPLWRIAGSAESVAGLPLSDSDTTQGQAEPPLRQVAGRQIKRRALQLARHPPSGRALSRLRARQARRP